MTDRIAHTAGTALGWLLMLGVAAQLAPEAAREAKELATELVASVRSRIPGGGGGDRPQDLTRQVQELKPATLTW